MLPPCVRRRSRSTRSSWYNGGSRGERRYVVIALARRSPTPPIPCWCGVLIWDTQLQALEVGHFALASSSILGRCSTDSLCRNSLRNDDDAWWGCQNIGSPEARAGA